MQKKKFHYYYNEQAHDINSKSGASADEINIIPNHTVSICQQFYLELTIMKTYK
jgi:hypothetical protein